MNSQPIVLEFYLSFDSMKWPYDQKYLKHHTNCDNKTFFTLYLFLMCTDSGIFWDKVMFVAGILQDQIHLHFHDCAFVAVL